MLQKMIVAVTFALASCAAVGDTIQIKGAKSPLPCKLVQVERESIAIIFENGLMRLPMSQVVGTSADKPTTAPASRMPDWQSVVVKLGGHRWASGLAQIPATVIDNGALRNVPYKSHRCGDDYEMNVYGDPASPAGFEIGIRGKLLDTEAAKDNCIRFVTSLLAEAEDRKVLSSLDRAGSIIDRSGFTFEITPPTAPDAYGGWWVSVYDKSLIDSMRATDDELKAITVNSPKPAAEPRDRGDSIPSREEEAAATQADSSDINIYINWSDDDYRHARRRSSSSSSTGSGPVYVRGYYRKDGTYVRPHTRSR